MTTLVSEVLVLPLNVTSQCCCSARLGMLPFLSTSVKNNVLKRAMIGVHAAEKLRCTSGANEMLFESRRGKTQIAGAAEPSAGATTHFCGTERKVGRTEGVSFHGPPSKSSNSRGSRCEKSL